MRVFRILFSLHLLSYTLAAHCSPQQPARVSMVQLIATPERFEGKSIRLTAFLHLELEGNALYLHREDYINSIVSNSIAIDFSDAEIMRYMKHQNSYVIIEGQFTGADRGHFGASQGMITKVTRLAMWKIQRK